MSDYKTVYLGNIPEGRELLLRIYDRLAEEGTAKRIFCDGTVTCAEEFADDLLRPGSLPFMVCTAAGVPAACGWLNSIEGRSAQGHSVVFKDFWGKHSLQIARHLLGHILTRRDEHGYLFDVILCFTPRRNALGWKMMERCGSPRVGVVPHFAYIAETGETEDAVLTVTTRQSLGLEN